MPRWRPRTHTNGLHHRSCRSSPPWTTPTPRATSSTPVALGPFLVGDQPVARSRRLTRLRTDAALLPPGVAPVRTATSGHLRGAPRPRRGMDAPGAPLGRRHGRRHGHRDRRSAGRMRSSTPPPATPQLPASRRRNRRRPLLAPGPRGPPGASGPSRSSRGPTSGATTSTVPRRRSMRSWRTEPDRLDGRVLLLHGPPGTGKTTALRALADVWRSWCRLEVVVDPERVARQRRLPRALPARRRRRRRIDLASRRARGLRRAHPGRARRRAPARLCRAC